jgi:competence protein ComEA
VSAGRGLVPLLGLLALLVATPARVEAQKKPLGPGERVDLNSATSAELMRLPGGGKKRADAIVANRDKRPFKTTDEVLRVKGLSPAWYSKVKGLLSVGEAPAAPRPPETARSAKGG